MNLNIGNTKIVSLLNRVHADFAAVVSGDSIFVIGGKDGTISAMTSCERYDPYLSVLFKNLTIKGKREYGWHFRWMLLPDMPTGRSSSGAIHIPESGVLVLGGWKYDPSFELLRTAELLQKK